MSIPAQGAEGAETMAAGVSPEAMLLALDRFDLTVLSRDVEPRDDDTWGVVDTKTADPKTNWPGELVSEHKTHHEARLALMQAVIAAATRPAGAVPDSLRALSEAASEDWDTNEATPYILGPPIDGDIDRFEVIARGPHGYAKNGDDIRKWQANRMFAVAAVKHVRTLLASHLAGQSAGSGAEDAGLKDAIAEIVRRAEKDQTFLRRTLARMRAEQEPAPDSTRTGQREAIARAAYVRICRHDSKEGWQHAGSDFDRREEDGGCYVNTLELALAIGSDAAEAVAARPAAPEMGCLGPASAPSTKEG